MSSRYREHFQHRTECVTGESVLPDFTSEGLLPPGRFSVTMEEAEDLLVRSPAFECSSSRTTLWKGFEQYLNRFGVLEDSYPQKLQGRPLIHRVWLGGSFVSAKPEPRNIDATMFIDVTAEMAVKGNPGSKWLTEAFKSRDQILRRFGVSPLRVGYRPVASVFDMQSIVEDDRTYFMQRGIWDDWWQRCRLPDGRDPAPTEASAVPVRGYLEVRL
ncbi:DUF6932 family protein [Streptomyces atratus]|uniref:DUF6932 family protein n=1 Tax=Streptomyces atratus TaxID=1893 RepID=UPI00366A45CC